MWSSLAVLAAVAGVAVAWRASEHGSAIDTDVFRAVALAVLGGRSPYAANTIVPFVYPPAGFLMTLPVAIGSSFATARTVWLVLSLLALARATWLLVRRAWPHLERSRTAVRVCWLFAAACLLQPTLVVVGFGQFGLVLLWLVVEGLRGQPDRVRGTWLVGVAAAVKLTPAVVLLALAAAGRWRAALWGVVGAVAATLAALVVSPPGVRDYVGGAWRWAYVVNDAPDLRNHSVAGVAAVLGVPSWLGLVTALVVLAGGVTVAATAWRRGDELAGLAAALLTGLLASPVSWEHHWVAAYPALVLLLREATSRRVGAAALLATGVLGMVLAQRWWPVDAPPWRGAAGLAGCAWYVAWAMAVLVWAARPAWVDRARPGIGSGAATDAVGPRS